MKHFHFCLVTTILLLTLSFVFLPGSAALAETKTQFTIFVPIIQGTNPHPSDLPTLENFSAGLKNNDKYTIQGVYVENVLALNVVQQPQSDGEFVSLLPNTATQYDLARQLGVIGLLAHNNLAGKNFFSLAKDNLVYVVYGDGSTRKFQIVQIDQYQALSPSDTTSSFKNTNTGEVLSASEIFMRYYYGTERITFQTCIAQDEIPGWGRLFVTAIPLP